MQLTKDFLLEIGKLKASKFEFEEILFHFPNSQLRSTLSSLYCASLMKAVRRCTLRLSQRRQEARATPRLT